MDPRRRRRSRADDALGDLHQLGERYLLAVEPEDNRVGIERCAFDDKDAGEVARGLSGTREECAQFDRRLRR